MDLTKLNGIIPDAVISQIPDVSEKFAINDELRLSHFLAQAAHESMGFRAVQENLNYSADSLKAVFGKYFPGNLNESYARQPQKIADRVYGSRMGNGDEASGDGWRYHGRGYIQLTGKINYQAFSTAIGEDCVANPDLVATKYPLASAGWFWHDRGLNEVADKGATPDVVKIITKSINGGFLGLQDRIDWFNKIYNCLSK